LEGVIPDYLVPFLKYTAGNLVEYQIQRERGETPDWKIKEAFMTAIGEMSKKFILYKDVWGEIEPLLHKHIL
jgi:hypothetical protein